MEICIRKMLPEDIEIVAGVFYAAFNSVGEKWDLPTAKQRILQYYNPEMCWVAVVNQKVVGVLTSKIDNVLDHQELYVDVIAVDPKLHKQGVGKKLLESALYLAKERGLKGLWLCASADLPSFDWYMKTGFKETSWKTLLKEIE